MSATHKVFSIVKVDGEVMLHDGKSGWIRAREGMSFRAGFQLTIKTGSTGHAEIANTNGERVHLRANSLKTITGNFSEDDIDTLRRIRLTARDMMAARVREPQRLAPAY